MKTKFIIVFFLIFILFINSVCASNNWITDENNRSIILHGLNISNMAKYADNQISWQTYNDYKRMKDEWGFNCIRLLIFWSSLEPEPGIYNQTYLDLIEERVNWSEELGLNMILDMHQDLYSKKFGGDGAPDWAVQDDGFSFKLSEPWWINYIQPAVRRAFKNFWTKDELQDHFINTWTYVAERFTNKSILGYEILNEPYFGTYLPLTFEKIHLKNFYNKVIKSIRSIDSNHYIFYEPQIMTSAGFKSYLPALNYEKVVYAPHFYQPTIHQGLPYFGFSYLIKNTLNMRNTEAENANVPWLLGEFGVMNQTYGMHSYLIDILSLLNNKSASWTYWAYDYYTQDGFGILDENGGELNQLKYLVYPYPQKISGTPITFNYDYKNKILNLEFKNNNATGPTEIYVGQSRIYPEGFNVICSDPQGSWHWEYDSDFDIVKIWTNNSIEVHHIIIKANE
jgi:endoglycosylceramidase